MTDTSARQAIPPLSVAVVHNVVSDTAGVDEQDVLIQAEAVSRVLRNLGHTPHAMTVDLDMKDFARRIRDLRPDVVFNLVESIDGEERLITLVPLVLDALSVPYTGVNTDGISLTSNKLTAKRLMTAGSIPTPPWRPCAGEGLAGPFDPPYIVKSAWRHGSVGLESDGVVYSKEELAVRLAAMDGPRRREFFVEGYIEGREFNISALQGPSGPRILPPAEIVFDDHVAGTPKVVGYRAKWDESSWEYGHTPRTFSFGEDDDALLTRLAGVTRACWERFGLNGYARVDFRVDNEGNPWVLEINANPCLSPDGGFAAAAEQGGMNYEELIGEIVALGHRALPV